MNNESSDKIRLSKYLALQRGISRRQADRLIEQGNVLINNIPAVLGARVASSDVVTLYGETVHDTKQFIYVLLNKPVDYVCSRRQQGTSDTVYALLPQKLHELKLVGRLDRDSSGLILLTNDGDFAFRMTHPKFEKTKVYTVKLDRELEPLHQQMISDHGILLEDGVSKLELMRLFENNRLEWQVTMHEGRNRQIRRTFNALGYSVRLLHRTQFGNYSLGDIESGEYKYVDIR